MVRVLLFLVLVMLCSVAQAAEIHEAAARGDVKLIRQLLADDPASLELPDKTFNKRTPLQIAIANKRKDAVAAMIAAGAKLDAVDADGYSALHIAIIHDQTEIALGLIDKGANVTLATADRLSVRDLTPLHLAASQHNEKVIRRLLDAKVPINAVDSQGRQPLHRALVGGNRGNNAADKSARVVLPHLVAAGADVSAVDREGMTALHHAAVRGMVESAQLLVRSGADPTTKTKKDKTAIQLARDFSHPELADWLANPTPSE